LPADAARRALIEHFAAALEVKLSAEARDRLAEHAASRTGLSTPPQIRRAIIGLADLAQNRGQTIDSGLIDEFFGAPTAARDLPLKAIAAAVSKQLDVSVALLRGKSRMHTVTAARSLAMHLARELTGATYAEIGRYFGNRDHTTVMYACKKAAAAVRNDARLRQIAAQLSAQLAAEEPTP
jgi:chromosomal replication initiator protein